MIARTLGILAAVALAAAPAAAQHDMAAHHAAAGLLPTAPGQAAFATIAEVVAILKADSTTDWSKVNLDALRQHLIDMDEVVMHASVAKRDVPGGMEATVTGTGRTVDAIRRMLSSHAVALEDEGLYHTTAERVANGMRLTVTANDPSDAKAVAMIRGLGFAGILTEGDHHARHHLAIARGDAHAHER